jgi:hypothetical protein
MCLRKFLPLLLIAGNAFAADASIIDGGIEVDTE